MRAMTILRKLVEPHINKVHAKRRETVMAIVESLLRCGRLSSASLGRAMPGPVAPKHKIKLVDRALGSEKLEGELNHFFAALARSVIRDKHPTVLVDWTRLNNDHCVLCAAIPVAGRALPIYLEVHPIGLWHKPGPQAGFLKALATHIIPDNVKPLIVTDAGFQVPWFKEVCQLGWDFLGHLNASNTVQEEGTQEWERAKELFVGARLKPKLLGRYTITKRHRFEARLVLSKTKRKGRRGAPDHKRKGVKDSARRKARMPCLLATSLSVSAKEIVRLYKARMTIEESFRDAKSHRFGWGLSQTRCSTEGRWKAMLLFASLGMLATYLVGLGAEATGQHLRFQANTIRNRRVLSPFSLGRLICARNEDSFGLHTMLANLRFFVSQSERRE